MKNHDPVETTPNDFREALALLEQRLRDCEDSASLIDGLLEGTAQFYGADRAYIIKRVYVDGQNNIEIIFRYRDE